MEPTMEEPCATCGMVFVAVFRCLMALVAGLLIGNHFGSVWNLGLGIGLLGSTTVGMLDNIQYELWKARKSKTP
jgi:hypothetical protein